MRKSVILSVALLVVLLGGLPVDARQAGPGRAPTPRGIGSGPAGYVPPVVEEAGPVRMHFLGLLHTGTADPGRQFSTRTLRDLLIVVEYRHLSPGPHTQRLKLFAPDGALYQQFTSEVQGGSAQPARGPNQNRVETRLPVGGTWITEHSLHGTWRLEVYVDTGREPTISKTFQLTR